MSGAEPVFLLPGEMNYSREPRRIATLLGSCVAVVLYDPVHRWGGMNHYLLPDGGIAGTSPGKAGDKAISMLLRLAQLAGSKPGELQASILGGGQVAAQLSSTMSAGMGEIGLRNISAAQQALAAAQIRVVRTVVGGVCGRRIQFQSDSGQLDIRDIPVSAAATQAARLQHRTTRVLIVDDSATVRGVLRQVISGVPDLEVCGEAADPFEARERIMECEPDVICLDIIMPHLDGLSFLRRLMSFRPIPTVIISTIAKAGSDMARRLHEAGAVSIIDKEQLRLYQGAEACRQALLPALRVAARTSVTKSEAR
jgi:chemotaxis receptor (MCP) glutamine deamidase CheD/AmiR/NasT family two-component response regulator